MGMLQPIKAICTTLVGAQLGSEGGLILLTGGCRTPPVPQIQLAEHRLHSESLHLAVHRAESSGLWSLSWHSWDSMAIRLCCRPPDHRRSEMEVDQAIWETLKAGL